MWQAIGPLHDLVTWYKITHAVMQVAQWDLKNKGRSRWTGMSCFVLEVKACVILYYETDCAKDIKHALSRKALTVPHENNTQ